MKRCPMCGKVVPQGHGLHFNQKYCSWQCYATRRMLPREEILTTLNLNKNITVTAELLGTDRATLYSWLKYYGIKKQLQYT